MTTQSQNHGAAAWPSADASPPSLCSRSESDHLCVQEEINVGSKACIIISALSTAGRPFYRDSSGSQSRGVALLNFADLTPAKSYSRSCIDHLHSTETWTYMHQCYENVYMHASMLRGHLHTCINAVCWAPCQQKMLDLFGV